MTTPDYLTSIDIGSSHIAILGCELFEGQEPYIVHSISSPSKGVDRGYISNISKASESLKTAINLFEKKSKVKLQHASFSIGGAGLCSQFVRTSIALRHSGTEINARDIQEVVGKAELLFSEKYPNKKILHVIPTSYRVDERDVLGSPVGMFGAELEAKIIMVTVPEHHFDALLKVAETTNININDIVAAPLADAYASLSYDQKKQGSVLVNIGSETTQVSTYEQGSLTSLKVMAIGSSDITNDLALGLQIPIEEAQEVKHGKNKKHPERKVQEIQSARLVDIIEFVEKHLKSIKKNRLLPAGVIWSGNGSLIGNINEYAKRHLHIPSSQVILEKVSLQTKRKVKIAPKYSTAYGLCRMEESYSTSNTKFSLSKVMTKVKYWFQQLRP